MTDEYPSDLEDIGKYMLRGDENYHGSAVRAGDWVRLKGRKNWIKVLMSDGVDATEELSFEDEANYFKYNSKGKEVTVSVKQITEIADPFKKQILDRSNPF